MRFTNKDAERFFLKQCDDLQLSEKEHFKKAVNDLFVWRNTGDDDTNQEFTISIDDMKSILSKMFTIADAMDDNSDDRPVEWAMRGEKGIGDY